jgi:hypothetical protein
MGLILSNHHIIFVTDVVVATCYVDILVAQPRNLSNIMGLSFSTPSHSALHIHIGCIYMLWMGIWVVRLDNCWVFGHTSKILEQYNSLWIIFDQIFSSTLVQYNSWWLGSYEEKKSSQGIVVMEW